MINNDKLAKIRRNVCKGEHPNFEKEMINTALKAIDDWFDSVKASGVSAVNVATTPFVFSSVMKKRLFAYWLEHKFNEEK